MDVRVTEWGESGPPSACACFSSVRTCRFQLNALPLLACCSILTRSGPSHIGETLLCRGDVTRRGIAVWEWGESGPTGV